MTAWLHLVFDDDAERIFLYRKDEIYRGIITKTDVELYVEAGSIVIEGKQLDVLVPEILDESKTTYLKTGQMGVTDIAFYPAEEGFPKKLEA
jgi:hypothetical protein